MTLAPPRRIGSRSRAISRPPAGPDPARLAAVLTRAWLEVRAGRRALAQLAPVVTPAVLDRLAAQLDRKHHGGVVPRVRRVTVSHPNPDACEACVTVEDDQGRTTAFALRLERHKGAWRVVELAAPEAGLAPLPATSAMPRARDAFDEVLAEDRHG